MRKVIGIGETVFDIIFRNNKPIGGVPGGSTFNSMISLGRCGIPGVFLSETGDDKIGDIVCSYLEENGVSSSGVDKGGKSHISLAFLNEKNDAEYLFYKDHPHDRASMSLPEINADDIVLFGSYYAINPVIRQKVKSLIEYAHNQGAIIYYDINFRSSHAHERDSLLSNIEENFAFADIIRGSNEDFQIVYNENDYNKLYSTINKCNNNKVLLYTCGADPTTLKSSTSNEIKMNIKPIPTVSTIGAGDNFNAGFIYSLIRDNIRKADIHRGLSSDQWLSVLNTAQSFSAECCQSIDNTISLEFAKKMKL
ncbi:MAG: PfkB family carbohydrate kinase [Bacteroidia bacterium]|nr:PfkB family carbohydrate kinase [Bacteroidia bacterium]